MSGQDDVVVADGIVEEIRSLSGRGETDDLLRAAEVWIRLTDRELPFFDEVTRQVAGHLEDGDRPLLHVTSDANADARFEVCVQFVTLHHVQWDGAVGKHHAASLRIDARRIGLESADTGYSTPDRH